MKRFLIAFVLIGAAWFDAVAERQSIDRYNSIIDRQMFGQPPPGFDPTKPPSAVSAKEEREKEQQLSKEQEQLKSAIHFSMINMTPSGATAVGFTDSSDSKNPRHYYLEVGQQKDGWLVKEADPVAATMTVVKGEVEVSLSLGGNSASGGGTKRAVGAPQAPNRAASPGAGMGFGSMRERRTRRFQQQQAEFAAMKAKAEQEKAEREAREAERAEREKAKEAEREAEREEQRAQLLQIKAELQAAREAAKVREESKSNDGEGEGQN